MDNNNLWWRDGIIYHIFPHSFSDSNGDGWGDLPGITSRLDYLKDLGVDALWISPIYPSPQVDFGYDVSDYFSVDPRFGSLQDFDDILQAAHARGIHIILDLVLNHTSDQHPWFLSSRKSRQDPYHEWYLWADPQLEGKTPNNWKSVYGGEGWEWDPNLGQYYFHMFFKQQPDLNWRCPAVRQKMLEVFRFWLDRGVDGFRLDVFNAYYKEANLQDNPPHIGVRRFDRQRHIHDMDQPEMLPLLAEIRQMLDSYPQRFAVGETFMPTVEKAAGYCRPGLLHAAFNFEFMNSAWRPQAFLGAIQRWEAAISPESWPTYFLNCLDNPRAATRYHTGEDDARLKVAAVMLLTQRGTPVLYYGEEIGMRDIQRKRQEIIDPLARYYWPFHPARDGCRAPMQWDGTAGAGFSSGTPWLPLHSDSTWRNVETQQNDGQSLWHVYQKVIQLRRETEALRRGMFMPLSYEPRRMLAYLRQTSDQSVLVALNFSRRPTALVMGRELLRDSWRLLFSTHRDQMQPIEDRRLMLAPYEALILSNA
jgi:alpha-glucosidase